MEYIFTSKAPAAIGPYSQAVKAGNILYTSGQIPINPETGDIIMDDVAAATHQVMKNLEALLSEAGTGFDRVIKTTIFLKSMSDFATVNEVYGSYLTEGKYPARETVQVSMLPKDVQIEISMTAQL